MSPGLTRAAAGLRLQAGASWSRRGVPRFPKPWSGLPLSPPFPLQGPPGPSRAAWPGHRWRLFHLRGPEPSPGDWRESLGGGSSGREGWLLRRWPGAGLCGLLHAAGGGLRWRDHRFGWAAVGGPCVSQGGGPTALRPGDDLPRGLVPVRRQTSLCSLITGRCLWGASRPLSLLHRTAQTQSESCDHSESGTPCALAVSSPQFDAP